MASELLIIRHGESVSNAARVVQKPQVPLSEQGHDQARCLGQRLAPLGVECVVASDLARAWQTAQAIVEATGAPILEEPLLAERNFGDLRGTPYSELGDRDIFAYDFAPPAGETGEVFDARVDRAWASIQAHAAGVSGRLAVVTHGLVCRSLALRHLDLDGRVSPDHWANTCVTVVSGEAPWRVSELACAAHLGETSREGGAV